MARPTLTQRLKQLGYPDYSNYLRSPHWQAVRGNYYRQAPRDAQGRVTCEHCRQVKPLHLHHKSYLRLGREQAADLALLCETCHSAVHGRDITKRRHRPASQRPKSAIPRSRKPTANAQPTVPANVMVMHREILVEQVGCNCGLVYYAACTSKLHF